MADTHHELALISGARQMLAEAQTLPDIRRVIEAASATAEVQRRVARLQEAQGMAAEVVRAAEDAANDAAAIRIEAQAKAGELVRTMRERGEIPDHGGDRRSTGQPVPLNEVVGGTSESAKKDAQRWQQVAEVPPPVREDYVEQTKAAGGEVTTSGLITHALHQGAIKSEVQLKAEEVIKRVLFDGPVGSKEFLDALKTEGISRHGLDLAKESLGITAERVGIGTVWKYAEAEDEVPRKGEGWECPTCGGYGWVVGKPKERNPRGMKRQRELEQDRIRRANKANGSE